MFKAFRYSLLILFINIAFIQASSSSEIPPDVFAILQKAYSNVNVRFDGLVELNDGTQYLPVYPLNKKSVENGVKIELTLPKGSKLESRPDFIFFSDNFSLFKVIKKTGEPPTLLDSNEIPLEVKLGLLPQDLLVPQNLVIPAELRVILGDLVIPVKEKDEFKFASDIKQDKKQANTAALKTSTGIAELVEKNIYVINTAGNTVNIIDSQSVKPYKVINLKSLPSDMALSTDKRYVLVTEISTGKLDIIDTLGNDLVKSIDLGKYPSSIAVMNNISRAYVANTLSSTISVIDLKNMILAEDIKVAGEPSKLVLSDDNRYLLYVDMITNKIYSVSLDEEDFPNEFLRQGENVSKVIKNNGKLYILNRADGILSVADADNAKESTEINVGKKPVDIKIINNKIYVLNAGDDTLSIIDQKELKLLKTVELKSGGFPKNITILNSNEKALITNANGYKLIVFDFAADEVIKQLPVALYANSLVVADKKKQ
jgi:YVTN family beta-propeller protein